MATSTTFKAIRRHFAGYATTRGLIEQLTPSLRPENPFTRSRRRDPLRSWAVGQSACLRHFEWFSDADQVTTSQGYGQDQRVVQEFALITLAYPGSLPGLAADIDEVDGVEDLMRSDAEQIHDCLFSPGNLYSGLEGVIPTVLVPERDGDVWFQGIRVELLYLKSMTLT